MPRLTIALCLLAQAFAQQEPVGKKIADPAAAATAGGALSSNAPSPVADCAAPVYEQAIALRPLVPSPRRDRRLSTGSRPVSSSLPWRGRRQHWLTSCPPLLNFVLDV